MSEIMEVFMEMTGLIDKLHYCTEASGNKVLQRQYQWHKRATSGDLTGVH